MAARKTLGNDLWHDSISIAIEFFCQNSHSQEERFRSHNETVRPVLTGRTLNFNWKIFEQSASENNHLMCYWSTIHNLICPKLQVLSFHFSELEDQLDKRWAKHAWKENIQLQSISNAIICVDQRLEVKIRCILSDLQIRLATKNEDLERKIWFKIVRYDDLHPGLGRSWWIHGFVVKTSRRKSWDMGSSPTGRWNSLLPPGHFAWHLACQCTDSHSVTRFYIAVLYLHFFPLEFCHWRSHADMF